MGRFASRREPHSGGNTLEVLSRVELSRHRAWTRAFAQERKDHRYYEIVEDTIRQDFAYHYFAIKNADGEVCAIQPFFILDQDILQAAGSRIRAPVEFVR